MKRDIYHTQVIFLLILIIVLTELKLGPNFPENYPIFNIDKKDKIICFLEENDLYIVINNINTMSNNFNILKNKSNEYKNIDILKTAIKRTILSNFENINHINIDIKKNNETDISYNISNI